MIKKKTVLDLQKFQSESSHGDEFCNNLSEEEEGDDMQVWTEEMYFNKKKEEILQDLRKNKFQKEKVDMCNHINSENVFNLINRSKSECRHGLGSQGNVSKGYDDLSFSSELLMLATPTKSLSVSPEKDKGIQPNQNFQLIIEVAKAVNDE